MYQKRKLIATESLKSRLVFRAVETNIGATPVSLLKWKLQIKVKTRKRNYIYFFTSFALGSTSISSSGKQIQTLARSAALVLTASINKIFPQIEELQPLPLLFSSTLLCVTKCKENKQFCKRKKKAIMLCIFSNLFSFFYMV